MSRFNQVISSFGGLFKSWQQTIFLDFGSANTRLMMAEAKADQVKLLWHQPTLLAWHHESKTVVTVGNRAADLRGKLPPQVSLISPVENGVIADIEMAGVYLEAVLAQLKAQDQLPTMAVYGAVVSLSAGATPVEKTQLQQVLSQAGFGQTRVVSKATALLHLENLRQMNRAHGVLDLGAETVELGLFVGQEIILEQTLKINIGQKLTQVVIESLLDEYELKVGYEVAQKIKHQLARLAPTDAQDSKLTVSGKVGEKITTVRVSADVFQPKFLHAAQQVVSGLRQQLANVSPEFLAQIQDQGLYLTGGSALVEGWKELIQSQLGVPVIISSQPTTDLVRSLTSMKKIND